MLHGGKDKRLSDKYFHNRRARPFPHLYLSESLVLGGVFPQMRKKCVLNRQMFFFENPEFLSTHNTADAMGVQVKLLISVKSDSWMHCFR